MSVRGNAFPVQEGEGPVEVTPLDERRLVVDAFDRACRRDNGQYLVALD